jgi:hypothetical protein
MRTFAGTNNLKNTRPENSVCIQIDVTKILPVFRFHQEHFCFSQLWGGAFPKSPWHQEHGEG